MEIEDYVKKYLFCSLWIMEIKKESRCNRITLRENKKCGNALEEILSLKLVYNRTVLNELFQVFM